MSKKLLITGGSGDTGSSLRDQRTSRLIGRASRVAHRSVRRTGGEVGASVLFKPQWGGILISTEEGNSMRHRALTRRAFIGTSAAVAGTILMPRPIRNPSPASAQTSAPPTVDRLAVRVVVDSYQDALVRAAKVGNVEVQRFGIVFGSGLGRHIHNEFGLSLHLESLRGSEARQALLDFGFTPTALLNNLELLKIDPPAIDALIVSHGHFDHFGGLVPFLKQDRGKMRSELPLYVGGE